QDVFDYDFGRERVFLEIANNEIEAKKRAEAKHRKSSCADISNVRLVLTLLNDNRFDETDGIAMTRKFKCEDLFRFNNVNLDVLTETYNMSFYLQYMSKWPDYFLVQEDPNNTIMGYIMGKAEGRHENWHGHVTAVTVAPEFRRLGLARKLMDYLENVSIELYDGYFVDLFVRVSNSVAIGMYERFGYSVYRRVLGYYSSEDDGEDAFDMRKALPRDKDKKSIIPLPHPVTPDQL
ncbi:TPA: hypothetical protein N0F65_007032, partial [Lagenidium giganteum]